MINLRLDQKDFKLLQECLVALEIEFSDMVVKLGGGGTKNKELIELCFARANAIKALRKHILEQGKENG